MHALCSDNTAAAWLRWFRGDESAAWLAITALQPKLYSNGFATEIILELEQEMRIEFRRRSAPLITERQPVDKWEWYFLMQHYHAPTPPPRGAPEGSRKFKSSSLQQGVLDVRDLKLGETAHLAGIFASRSHADPGRARARGLYNGASHAYLSNRMMK